MLRDRRAVRAQHHAAESAGRAEESRRARHGDHARVRPRRRLPAGVPALPRPASALGHLPAGTAGRPGHAAGHHHRHVGGRTRQLTWAEETVQVKDYGQARQITLFEHGRIALQILTSDFGACPADILSWPKSRWREENFLKYASENYGIDKICDYLASIETNTKIVGNPARKAATAAVREAEKALAGAERELAGCWRTRRSPPPPRTSIPALQRKITRARQAAAAATTARKDIPAKLPASDIDPDAKVALLRAGRRGLQMVLRLLAHNAEHWLSTHLNAYLRDDDEYRAITRQTIIRGLAGTITFTPAAITVHLEQPGAPRIARALALLIHEINATPPAMPGDHRPITCQLAAPLGI